MCALHTFTVRDRSTLARLIVAAALLELTAALGILVPPTAIEARVHPLETHELRGDDCDKQGYANQCGKEPKHPTRLTLEGSSHGSSRQAERRLADEPRVFFASVSIGLLGIF